MKRCFKCLQVKPLDEFYMHSRMLDKRLNKCKECTKEDTKKNRLAKIEHYRSYDRMRGSQPHRVQARKEYQETDAYKASHTKSLKKQYELHPKKRVARYAVSNAIRDGRLEKQPCFVCGQNAEAHHPDYDRPLDVVWLCDKHHKEAHKMAREIERERKAA
jgi:hypothetical protein